MCAHALKINRFTDLRLVSCTWVFRARVSKFSHGIESADQSLSLGHSRLMQASPDRQASEATRGAALLRDPRSRGDRGTLRRRKFTSHINIYPQNFLNEFTLISKMTLELVKKAEIRRKAEDFDL